MTASSDLVPLPRVNASVELCPVAAWASWRVLLLLLLSWILPVHAACWPDSDLAIRAQAVAGQRFPALVGRMPDVLACHDADFPPQIGGDYTSGIHRIRIPQREVLRGPVVIDSILAHELGHAQVAAEGKHGGPDGHGEAWVQAMLRAGLDAEVERMARFNPYTAAALGRDPARAAGGGTLGVPPTALPSDAQAPHAPAQPPPTVYEQFRRDRPPILRCEMQWRWFRLIHGGRVVEAGRWVPICHAAGP